MVDIYVRISDEEGRTLNVVNIYENGSDSEYADEIVDMLQEFEGARIVDESQIPD